MKQIAKIAICVTAGVIPIVMYSYPTGAPPRRTQAPGDKTCLDSGCHTGTAFQSSSNIAVQFPNGATYTPGVKQTLTVTATDPFALRFGFELTARLASDTTNGQAGTLTPPDTTVAHLECDGDPNVPTHDTSCPTAQTVQFITHSAPQNASSANSATWQVDWTPPATNAGNVTFYLAVNASNAAGPQNKHIHFNTFQVTPAGATTCPTTSTTPLVCGVANGASFASGIAPGAWFTISGLDLSTTNPGRIWAGTDFTNGGNGLPLSLDGTGVTVNGKPAYVEYVSPTQVNALAPADTSAAGQQVPVVVTLNGATSASFMAPLNAVAPAFFEDFPGTADNGKYLIAQHSDYSLVGKPGLYPSAPNLTTPAKAGETVIFYGSGFGPTSPAEPDGQLVTQVSVLATLPTITVGGQAATVVFAGLVPPFAGVYQFNVTLPATLTSGDQPVVATLGNGAAAPSELITIQ